MRVLLDTHILLWALGDTRRLGKQREDVLSNASNVVFVSALSLAEVAIKASLGKLEVPSDLAERVIDAGFTHLPFDASHASALAALPFHHRDPFDRMLIAQAMADGLVFATADDRCRAYDIRTI